MHLIIFQIPTMTPVSLAAQNLHLHNYDAYSYLEQHKSLKWN